MKSVTRVHVNGQALRQKKPLREGKRYKRVFSVWKGSKHYSGTRVVFRGPTSLIYKPNHKFRGYVKAWIETKHPVEVYWGRERVL